MLSNNNLKVCRTLVMREFRFHRVRMLLLAAAAALVTALYSFLFLLGGSVKDAFLLNYQYTYGSASHILYTGLTGRQADAISGNANVKNSVRIHTVGQLSDPMMGQRLVKLAVTDRDYAETVLSVPTEGRLPEHAGEIALDEFTMDSLGILHEEGASVVLEWTDPDGETRTSEFTLCGWWASPTNFTEACAWITAETAQDIAPEYHGESAGNVTLGVNLFQPKDLDIQTAAILEEQGIPEVGYTTNLAYNDARRETAWYQARSFYSPVALVLLCGYLMIYAIVQAASQRDTLFYAGLKSLGMTPRQLRRFLMEQGAAVSLLGILPGWMLGFFLHFVITGRVVTGMEQNPALYFLTWQPFALAALCTVGTTLLAYLLPAARISRILPAKALLLAEGLRPKKRRRRDGRTTLSGLAFRTLGFNRWRTAVSAIALMLSVLLLSSVWIQYVSLQEDIYLSAMSPWDYSLADGSAYLSVQRYNEKTRGITEETVEALLGQPEVTAVGRLKSRELAVTAPDALRQRIVDYYNQPYDETMTLRESQAGFPQWCAGLDRLEESGQYTALVIGLDGAYLDYVLENSPFTSGSFDEGKFAGGDFVLAGGAYYEGISTPMEGETVELAGENFTVLGSVMHDDSYLRGSNSIEAAYHIVYLMPVDTFDRLFPEQGYRQLAVDIDRSRQAEFEDYLEGFEQGLNRGVGITTRGEYQKNFEAARLNEVLPNLVIGLVMMSIALVNFINLLVIKAMSRKGELAVYESLGMTRAQLRKLMFLEGIFHAGFLAVLIVPVTLLFDRFAMPGIVEAGGSWIAVYTFSAAPLWLVLLVMVGIAVAVPLGCLHFITKGSLTERMRTKE